MRMGKIGWGAEDGNQRIGREGYDVWEVDDDIRGQEAHDGKQILGNREWEAEDGHQRIGWEVDNDIRGWAQKMGIK